MHLFGKKSVHERPSEYMLAKVEQINSGSYWQCKTVQFFLYSKFHISRNDV